MNEALSIAAIAAVTVATVVVGARGMRISRTRADFLVAARQVRPMLNASAISGEYLSAASFLGVAGLAMLAGLGALWYAVGYAAGYLILLTTVAAPLRRFGAYTIPDFAEGRLESAALRKVSTAVVLVIAAFYLLPQLKGAGLTLQVTTGAPYWIGVVVLGAVVTANIAAGGMKGITIVQAFQYWLKLTAIAVPVLFFATFAHHVSVRPLSAEAATTFPRYTTVKVGATERLEISAPVKVWAKATVDGRSHDGALLLAPGTYVVHGGGSLGFPAGSRVPRPQQLPQISASRWEGPFVHIPGNESHPLLATYGIIIATFLGTIGLPHILVRFYTNRDGRAARRTTALVILLLAVFYVFPGIFAALGRLNAPGLYVGNQTDSVVLVLPRLLVGGLSGAALSALTAAGAFAAFLSTSSGLLISAAGALSHDLLRGGVRTFRTAAVVIGAVATAAGIIVAPFAINILVGWAFAIAASTFCPLLVLGIWWRRLTRTGALAGLVAGGVSSSLAIVAAMAGGGTAGLAGVLLAEPAVWTVPIAFATMLMVSHLTPQHLPRDVTGKLLALHLPEGVGVNPPAPTAAPPPRRRAAAPAPRRAVGVARQAVQAEGDLP
jgi:Na+(H+)/acetate symporter ActP